MNNRIWIINHYASDMYFQKGGRHYYFAKYLLRAGYSPTIFCANTIHNTDKVVDTEGKLYKEDLKYQFPFVFVKSSSYKGNGLSRINNMVSFYFNVKKVAKQYAQRNGKPDIIYASSAHPLAVIAGIKLAKKFGVKCIGEVRDLWPLSIVEYSGKLTNKNLLIKLLYQGEKWMYKKVDKLIFTMQGGYDYITDKGWDKVIPKEKVFHINNGVDLETFNYNKEHYKIKDEDLSDNDIFKVVYTGTIRKVNNLGLLLDIAKNIKNEEIRFLVWGDGNELPVLKKRLIDDNINNVVFKGRVDKKFVPYIVSNADLNFAHNTPTPLFKYGISFNKMFDYIASGRPILSDFPCSYNPAVVEKVGYNVESERAIDISLIIDKIANNKISPINPNNFIKAREKYDFKNLTNKLINIIEDKELNEEECSLLTLKHSTVH